MILDSPVITGSLVVSGSISAEGQPAGTVESASFASTASYVEASNIDGTVTSASYAISASYAPVEGFPYTGSATISGSLNVDGPITASAYSGDGSELTGIAGFPHTGSGLITGSFGVTGSVGFAYFSSPSTTVTTFDYSSTTGETTVSCLIETSAERYKDNIQPMGSQLNKVMQLQPVEFDWKSNKKHDIGFVADSVKNVYPNLVSEKDGQVEGMNYSKLVSALVKSIQEQQTQIDELKTRLDNNN